MNQIFSEYSGQPEKLVVCEEGFRIVCGKSSISLYPDGRIELKGTSLIQAADSIVMQAEFVDINP